MTTKNIIYFGKLAITTIFYLLVTLPLVVSAAQITLEWDENTTKTDGYRIFQRQADELFDYSNPVWTGTATLATIDNLNEGDSYFFVVRAYVGDKESSDSNEVAHTPAIQVSDSDGDGWNDASDAFPSDPYEWLDTDGDGVGNNADLDDDGDGMPDSWEIQYDGLDPLVDDADGDLDGDGTSNIEEYASDSDPSAVPGNLAPEQPVLSTPVSGAVAVSLTPTLVPGTYSDPDGDSHLKTCYQISTDADFSSLVFERTSQLHKNSMRISEMILDPDTTYFWRVKYFDNHNGASEWSDSHSFLTIDYETAGDLDGDGILDDQSVDEDADLDGNGTSDALQSGLQAVITNDTLNPQVAVKGIDSNAILAGMRALDADALGQFDNEPDQLSGLISFKLILSQGASSTSVTVFLSQPAPEDAQWYKFDPDQGWTVYEHAVFNTARTEVTITLEDGGAGDEDGVVNGVIVDPSGLGYSRQSASTPVDSGYVPVDAASGGGCFIGASTGQAGGFNTRGTGLLTAVLGALLVGFIGVGRSSRKR